MSSRIHLSSAARRVLYAAALTATIAGPAFTSAAYAFDPYGSDDSVILHSAQSARYANPQQTPLANATAQARTPQVASTVRVAPVSTDLVGQHGEQDRINQSIYAPGTPLLTGG
jgi:hypothetical protein